MCGSSHGRYGPLCCRRDEGLAEGDVELNDAEVCCVCALMCVEPARAIDRWRPRRAHYRISIGTTTAAITCADPMATEPAAAPGGARSACDASLGR